MLSLITCAGFHENNEELQAAMLNKGLEEGRTLLSNPQHTNSLAAEFEAMSENEVRLKKNTWLSLLLSSWGHFFIFCPSWDLKSHRSKCLSLEKVRLNFVRKQTDFKSSF